MKYFIYVNQNDLLRFLSKNIIFPFNGDYQGKRSYSLAFDNKLILADKRYEKESIIKQCVDGFYDPVVIEVDINPSNELYDSYSDGILLNGFLDFSYVYKIYHIGSKIRTPLFNDVFLFSSLRTEKPFVCGKQDCLELSLIEHKESKDIKLDLFDRVKAFYMARFGYLSEFKYQGKKLLFMRNIDASSFKYVSSKKYQNVLKDIYPQKEAVDQSSLLDSNLDFENALSEAIDNPEPTNLYRVLLYYSGDLNIFKPFLGVDIPLEDLLSKDVGDLKDLFTGLNNETKRIIILMKIIPMDLQSAKSYISNFVRQNSESEKELLSNYGLANGMSKIGTDLKQRADLLLFSLIKAERLVLKNLSYGKINFGEYFANRDYRTDYVLETGFDFKIFDFKAEVECINRILTEKLVVSGLPSDVINTKILNEKKLSPKRLHELFLNLRKENRNA